jgi:hypothetical protein
MLCLVVPTIDDGGCRYCVWRFVLYFVRGHLRYLLFTVCFVSYSNFCFKRLSNLVYVCFVLFCISRDPFSSHPLARSSSRIIVAQLLLRLLLSVVYPFVTDWIKIILFCGGCCLIAFLYTYYLPVRHQSTKNSLFIFLFFFFFIIIIFFFRFTVVQHAIQHVSYLRVLHALLGRFLSARGSKR